MIYVVQILNEKFLGGSFLFRGRKKGNIKGIFVPIALLNSPI